MEARIYSAVVCLLLMMGQTVWSQGTYQVQSENFVVHAPDLRLAQQASKLAEQYRRELSVDWLGYEIPRWNEKCPIQIEIGPFAGGETSFAFVQGHGDKSQPISWQMKIFGPPDRLLDAVLPHEITHTIFATHFGRPLPRWADEGACTTVEHESERAKNHRMLIQFLTAKPSRGIPFNRMFTMKQYPHDILPLYAQGYSVAKYLIGQKGRQYFVKFLERGMAGERGHYDIKTWDKATEEFYGYKNLSDLQVSWLKWVSQGSPQPKRADIVSIANHSVDPPPQSKLLSTDSTYALARHSVVAPNPLADQVQRQGSPTRKLNSWYARESRAKQAVPSSPQNNVPAKVDPPTVGFLPGSLKRADPTQLPWVIPNRPISNESSNPTTTLWR